jgi:hypothetical protein
VRGRRARVNEGPTLPRLTTFVVCCVVSLHPHVNPHHPRPASQQHHTTRQRPADDAMSTPTPLAGLAGHLVPLRTKDEVRASLETHSAYVVEVPAKFANAVKE